MTANDIERLEQAARSVFGCEQDETPAEVRTVSFSERIRTYFQSRLTPRAVALPGA
jgi:hypothetical protein